MSFQARKRAVAIAVIAAFSLSACTTDPYTGEKQASKTAIGAGVGAAVGAGIGAIAGKRKATLIGAGVGALAGGAVGAYMDSQEAKLRRQLQDSGVSVTRQGDNIILNMPGNITFDTDSANIKPDFTNVLDSVALVLNEYEKTYLDVLGHTDSTGSESYNMDLSIRRASSVATYLTSRKVLGDRLIVRGMGETQPIASNATAEGRALNRRVELQIIPIT